MIKFTSTHFCTLFFLKLATHTYPQRNLPGIVYSYPFLLQDNANYLICQVILMTVSSHSLTTDILIRKLIFLSRGFTHSFTGLDVAFFFPVSQSFFSSSENGVLLLKIENMHPEKMTRISTRNCLSWSLASMAFNPCLHC